MTSRIIRSGSCEDSEKSRRSSCCPLEAAATSNPFSLSVIVTISRTSLSSSTTIMRFVIPRPSSSQASIGRNLLFTYYDTDFLAPVQYCLHFLHASPSSLAHSDERRAGGGLSRLLPSSHPDCEATQALSCQKKETRAAKR